ncbi:MAG: dienelactone hydrolase family protein [Planctomycetes bacterium]|nr:dienelactone hydrolase family protein [Planctomycetota bacterium]
MRHGFSHDVPCEVRRPADADGSVVVALHGMGQSAAHFERDAAPLVPPGATLILPQGPYPFEMRSKDTTRREPPRQGNAWYVWTGDSGAFVRSLADVASWLLAVIDSEIASEGLDGRRAALVGFSQGGYLAGFVGVRNAARFRALVVASGRMKDEILADAAPAAAAAGLRVLDVHGEKDEAVRPEPCRASAERLAALGLPLEFRTYDAGHAVLRDARCRDDVKAFLGANLR